MKTCLQLRRGSVILLATWLSAGIAVAGQPSRIELKVDRSVVELNLPADQPDRWRDGVVEHVKLAAEAVSKYLGGFPVPRTVISVSAEQGRHVNGREFNGDHIKCEIGEKISAAELADDWVMTHEMFHLAFPEMDDRYEWMNEGLSDYLEPVARAALGQITEEDVWKGFIEGMPKGQPKADDRGLDNTHTWGRTYWGGCTYWLLADLRIREKTGEKKSLRDAIRAIVNAGGTGDQTWPLDKVFRIGDGATGTTVLSDLHTELGPQAKAVDLDALWRSLGITYRGGKVTFSDDAPKAGLRKAITANR